MRRHCQACINANGGHTQNKRNCALLKAKLDINIKTKFIYCVQYIAK
jgi:hypothetical protein